MTQVTTYYLEMTSPSALNEKREPNGLQVVECEVKQFELNRFLYNFVGSTWSWRDKYVWSDEQWRDYAESDNLRTWLGLVQGSPAGYYELQQQGEGNVEIAYFGLAPNFIGQGLGSDFLSQAIKSAWAWEGTQRVWLQTSTTNHPNSLRIYQARGLTIYETKTNEQP